MKRILILLVSVLFAVISYGQAVNNTAVNKKLDINENLTYWYKTGVAVDTINQADTLWSYTFGVDNLYDVTKQYVKIDLDSVSGTPLVTAAWQGKYFWDDATWTSISTAAWAGTTSDTTLLLDQSTAKHYRYYRLLLDGDGTGTFKAALSKFQVQFYK